MTEDTTQKAFTPEQGPATYLNWLAAQRGTDLLSTFEYSLYTDAHITGEIEQGPYQFLNTIAMPPGVVRAAVILRYSWYWEFPPPNWAKTDAERYHGGLPADELAALASLAMGVRFRAGDATREFRPGGDPKGRPIALTSRAIPLLTVGGLHRWLLPAVAEGQHPLDLLSALALLPRLRPAAALTLIRCARLYQDALWMAESQPALAWLLLVSALETGAVHWRTGKEDAVVRFRTENTELHDDLAKFDSTMPGRVAEVFKDSFGVTKKFIDFVLQFRPPEPSKRPRWPTACIDWSDDSLEKTLKIIYRYRSKALHEGRPFPGPMCEAPMSAPDTQAEKPFGDVYMTGSTWKGKDLPLFLQTFEYIAREALLNWLKAQAPQESKRIENHASSPLESPD